MLDTPIVVTSLPSAARANCRVEMCEHKGIGHPDSICDGVAEAVSRSLCQAYLAAYGQVQHHNVDKALLVGGQSEPRFGGGRLLVPMRLIICGRATPLSDVEISDLVRDSARAYLSEKLRCPPQAFIIESAVRPGSANLRQVFARGAVRRLANDTSFGTGFAPYSALERSTLRLADVLRSASFREAFPAAGDDYKIMATRVDEAVTFTVALAIIAREIRDAAQYFSTKAEILHYLDSALGIPCRIQLNMLDDVATVDESGVYLTVTGLSAEHGDDGQVGRGNRVNGLITPFRTMSLEAAAGKNPVAHVGKIYNVLAKLLAEDIVAQVDGVDAVTVRIVSTIGKPVDAPQLISIEVTASEVATAFPENGIRQRAQSWLTRIDEISDGLIRGVTAVF